MKEKYVKIINLIVAVLVALFCIGQVFAWFADRKYEDEANFGGSSAGAYFAYGDGSSENPFGINKPNHLYNLAWLQNTGRFDKQYYFELDPDMEGPLTLADDFWLPPIGNEENPFEGVFDGRGKTISNLRITTDKAKLYMNPFGGDDESYEFSQAVGFFGNTSGEDCAVKNFILDNPLVQVSSVNTKYSAEGNKAVGIAVGHVEGLCQSIGVYAHGSTATPSEDTLLDVQVTEYNTFNSILGELGAGVTSSVTGGGHGTGGSGNAFGGNLELVPFAELLNNVYMKKYNADSYKQNASTASPNVNLLPEIDTSNQIAVPALGYEVPFTLDESATKYEGRDAKLIPSINNVGYLIGNQNKISSKTINWTDDLMKEGTDGKWYLDVSKKTLPDDSHVPRWLYVQNNGWTDGSEFNSQNGFAPLSKEKFDSLPQNIKDLLDTKSHNLLRIQSEFNQYQHPAIANSKYDSATWGYHGQINWMGQTYGSGYNMNNYIADENGYWFDGVDTQNRSGWLLDENEYRFKYGNSGEKIYAAAMTVLNQEVEQIIIEQDGRVRYSYDSSWYFHGENGDDFNAFSDDYVLHSDNKFYYADGAPVYLYDKWDNKNQAELSKGIKIPSYANSEGIVLPNNGLWFKPSNSGTCRFIMFAQDDGQGFDLLKITRTEAKQGETNPFYTVDGSDINVEVVLQQALPSYVMFYFEFEVKAEEVYNTEYLILYGNNLKQKGAFFVYLDIGASADDNSAVVPDVVSAVDFIYEGVEIAQDKEEGSDFSVGDFIVQSKTVEGKHTRYNATRTSVYFENISLALQVAFVRVGDEGSAYTLRVVRSSEQVTANNVNLVEWTDTPSIAVPGLSG